MVAASPEPSKQRRVRIASHAPDPLRAHGAWVYLLASILAGTLTVGGRGLAPALATGGCFLGIFVSASSVAHVGRRGAILRLSLGLLLTTAFLAAALELGADRSFFAVALLTLPPLFFAAISAQTRGFLSPSALCSGVTALAVAAPAVACAGGASRRSVAFVLMALAPFFFWRTWRLAQTLGRGWTRPRLRRRGLLESALAVGWAILVGIAIRLLA